MKKNKRIQKLFFICTAVSLLALLYFFKDARNPGFFPRCPFYLFSGLFCPGCGSQRAISSLLHGDIVQALHFNILLLASVPIVLYAVGVTVINAFSKNQVVPYILYSPVFVKIFLALVLFFFVVRNIPIPPFNFLAPHITHV